MFDLLPYLPIEEGAEIFINWLNANFDLLFDFIAFLINGLLNPLEFVLTSVPAFIILLIVTVAGYVLGKLRLAFFIAIALMVIGMMGYWPETMVTLSLVLTATFFSLIIGVPLGILKAHNKIAMHILDPVLDFMQTMPLFVYLIPAVLFFSIGNVPGIVSTFIFATPPAVRLTSLGIEQVSKELKEAAHAFGASPWQFLTKVEIPLAMPSIMMGINQAIMLSLSMVVVASMIGAEGLGQEVLRGIMRLNVGQGIASGLGIVLLAMVLDRLTRKLWKR
jgi:ABC-type proline/glycine betaine transport system permease subunit